MALIQHRDEKIRFQQQADNARAYVLPFIEESFKIDDSCAIMDIGCGDGGVLLPFLEKGCKATGVELDLQKSDFAKEFLHDYIDDGKVEIINQNIYEEVALEKLKGQFDLILLKDVIEHIPDQKRFIPYLKKFLKPKGRIYFGFPPWYMPHGGHQQVCNSRFLGVLPYFHILPAPFYKLILRMFGEDPNVIKELLEIKETGISIERFEDIVKTNGYKIENERHYLINPIYQFKFRLKPRVQFSIIKQVPFVRNFLTTCVYYLIRSED